MKLSRKILSLVLALVMVMGLAATAFAEEDAETTTERGSITITNALGGETYNAYQILYLESYNAEKKIYAYKANSAWEEWLRTQTTYVSFDSQGYVTWVEGASAADFAKAAKGQLSDKSADGHVTPSADGSATISNLKLGYYLVDSTVGALCELNTTKPGVEIMDKNPIPTIEKKVQEDSDETWGDVNDADIGQTVKFKSTISAKPGARKYIVHDKMDSQLEFGGVTSITAGDTTLAAGEDYTVVTSGLTDGCTFHIVFNQTYLDSITADTKIVINYTAKLTSDAVAGTGYVNDTWLNYGDSQHTEHDSTTTYTWKLPIYKYHMDGETKTALPGAEFILYKGSEENRVYAQVTEGKLTGWTTTKTDATTLVSDNNGMIEVEGLDADTYYLEETKAPGGYNKLAGPVTVVISHTVSGEGAQNMTHTLKQDTIDVGRVEIENKSGTELPETGGIGTTIFYVLGSILVIGAVVLLITKKRMSAAA